MSFSEVKVHFVSNMSQQRDGKWSAFAGQKSGSGFSCTYRVVSFTSEPLLVSGKQKNIDSRIISRTSSSLFFYPGPSLSAAPGWRGIKAPGGPCLSRSGTPPAPPSTCLIPTASAWSSWAWCSTSSGAQMTLTTGSMASWRPFS